MQTLVLLYKSGVQGGIHFTDMFSWWFETPGERKRRETKLARVKELANNELCLENSCSLGLRYVL